MNASPAPARLAEPASAACLTWPVEVRKAWMDARFGDFNRSGEAQAAAKHPVQLGDMLYRYLFDRFRPFMEEGARRDALSVGLQNPLEIALLGELFGHTTIFNPSGGPLGELMERGIETNFSLAFGQPENLSRFDGEPQDAIASIHTFNFFDNAEAVMDAMAQALAPDGRVYLAVQNARAGSRQLALSMGFLRSLDEVPSGQQKIGQRRFLDLDGLRDLARGAGLREVASGGAMVKTLTEAQMETLISKGLVGEPYLRALFELGRAYPELCATVWLVAER